MKLLMPIHLEKWIEENREALKPPVGNKCIYDAEDLIVMVVAGPNQRRDFHVDPYEEFFYQIKGDINLKVIKDEKIIDVWIKEGELYLLPRNIPHSPRRPEHTIGIVIERKRQPTDQDIFQWYCEKCNSKLHEERVFVKDLETDIKDIFKSIYNDPETTRCKHCSNYTHSK
jgi:3-hydroxyanthranilate 3,4-dioxygenase